MVFFRYTRNIGELRDVLMRTGRSVAFITADDWEKNTGLWQTVVIPLPGLLSSARKTALVKQFGALPDMKLTDDFLILQQNKPAILSTLSTVRQQLVLPEAAAATAEHIWYIGGNFTAVWDGQMLDIRIAE